MSPAVSPDPRQPPTKLTSKSGRQKKTHPVLKPDGSADHRAGAPARGSGRRNVTPYACFLSKNCSSSVEPFSAPVEASRSIVVVTASK